MSIDTSAINFNTAIGSFGPKYEDISEEQKVQPFMKVLPLTHAARCKQSRVYRHRSTRMVLIYFTNISPDHSQWHPPAITSPYYFL